MVQGYSDRTRDLFGDRDQNRPRDTTRHTPSLGKRVAVGFALAGAVIVPLTAFMATEKTPADKIALSYGGGPFEGNQYQKTVQPGSGLVVNGIKDGWYEYPVTIRNYIVSASKDEGDKETFDVIKTSDHDGVEEQAELTLSFKLNTALVRDFHEKVGLKYHAWGDDGWKDMMGDYLRQPLNNAVAKSIKGYSTDDIKKDPKVLKEIEDAIGTELERSLSSVLGKDYFCGPTFDGKECGPIEVVVKSVVPSSKSVNASYDKQKSSANGVITAKNEANAQIERAKGERAAKDAVAEALTPEYLAYMDQQAKLACAKNDNCTMVTTDAGGQLPALTIPIPTPGR